MKTALITGVAGQDGVYLARSLRREGHRVVGTVRPGTGAARADYLCGVEVVEVDLCDKHAMIEVVEGIAPDLVFNLAALSSVGQSWQQEERTLATNAEGVEHLVGALIRLRDQGGVEPRLLQASSAESDPAPTSSPYARAKAAADETVVDARRVHGLFAVRGMLHNHESPLRGDRFVTRKISRTVAEIATGRSQTLVLGNLDVVRDWGFAGDHVEAMRLMLDQAEPQDLTIGTGVPHSLRDMVDRAFAAAGLGTPGDRLQQDPALLRPNDVPVLIADPEPAAAALGWRARVTFDTVVDHMVSVDLARLRSGIAEDAGYLYPA